MGAALQRDAPPPPPSHAPSRHAWSRIQDVDFVDDNDHVDDDAVWWSGDRRVLVEEIADWPRSCPVLHLNIQEDFPLDKQRGFVRSAYRFWLYSWWVSVINFVAVMATLLTSNVTNPSTMVLSFMFSAVYLFAVFFLWFRPLYWAVRLESSVLFFWFYLFSAVIMAFFFYMITQALGLVSVLASPLAPGSNLPVKVNPIFPTTLFTLVVLFYLFGVLLLVYYISTGVWWHRMADREKMLLYKKQKRSGWLAPWYGGSVVAEADLDDVDDDGSKPKYSYATILSFEKSFDDTVDGSGPLHEDPSEVSGGAAAKSSRRGKSKSRGSVHDTLTLPGSLGIYPNTRKIIFKSHEAIFNNLFKMTVLFLNITSLRTEGELLLVITEKLNSGVPRDDRRKFNEDTPTCVLPGEEEGPRVRELRLDFDTLANRDECHRQLQNLWKVIKKKENLYVAEDEAELKSMRTRLAARTRERAAQHLLTHKDWNLLVSYVWRREYQAGEIILNKGETFNEVQHVTQGVVDIYLETTEGARSKQEKKEMELTRESLGMGEDLDLQALLFPVTDNRISKPAPDLPTLEGQSRAVPRFFKVRFPKRSLGLSYCKTKRGYNLDEYTRHEATPKRTYPDNLAAIVHAVKRNGEAARLGVRAGDELVRVELYDVEANGLTQRAITSLIKSSQFPLNLEFRRPPEVEFDEDDRGFLEPNQHLVPEEARNNLSGYERAAVEGRATREPLVSVRLDSPAGELDEEEAAALLARTYRDGDSTSEEGGGSDADELEHDVEGALLPQPNVPNALKGSSSSKAAAVAPFPSSSPSSPPATPPLSRRPSAGGAFFGRPYSAAAGMGRSPSPAARSSSFRSRGSDLIELRSLHSGEAAADDENFGGAANGAQHSLDLAEQYAEQVAAESAELARRQEQQHKYQQQRQQQQQLLQLQQLQPPGSGSRPRSPSRGSPRGGSPQPLTQFKQLGRTYASYAVRPAETIEFDANAPTVKDLEMQELGNEAAQPASMARRYSMVRRLLSQGTQYLFGARFRYNRVEDVGTLRPQMEPEHRFSFAGGSYAGSRRGSLGGPDDGLRDDISIVADRAGARGAGAPPPGDGDSSDDESVGDYFYGLRVFEPVGTFERGDTIGVVPWILNQPVSVSQLRAKTDVVIHAISVADLTALFRKNGTLALAFFKYVAAVIGERADRDEEVLCDQIEEQMRGRDKSEEQTQALTRLLDSKPIRSTQSTMFQQRVFETQKARKWFETDFDMAFDSIIFSEPCTMTIVGDIKVLIGRSWYGVDTRSLVEYMQPKEGVLYVTKYYVCFRTTKRALDITKLKRRPTLYGKVHLNDIYEVRRLGADAEQVTLLTDELRLDISFPSPGKSELVEDWINALLNAGTMVERAPHSYTLPGDLHGLSSGTADAKLPLSVASDPMNVCFAKQHDLRTEFLVLTQTLQQVLTKQDRFKMFHDGSSVTLKRGQNVLTASRFASDMRADEDSGADPARARRTTTAPQAMKADGPNGLYLLGAGELIVQREVNGRRVQFACYKVGTVFGVERFLTGAPSPFTVKVSSERAMLKFAPRERCMALLKADLSLAARFYQYCALLQLQRLRGPLLSKPQEEPWEHQVARPSRGTQGCSIL